jgi:hypothetical protein
MVEEKKVENYILQKEIVEEYNIEKTTVIVKKLVNEYKKARYMYLVSRENLERVTTHLEPINSQFSKTRKDTFGNSIATMIDSEETLKNFELIFADLVNSFVLEEKKYYFSCLAGINSESYLAESLNMSRSGLKPYKESCIIKIALAFHIEVEK